MTRDATLIQKFWYRLGILAFLTTTAWVRPAAPVSQHKPADSRGQHLDYVIVVVNGAPRLVRDGTEISIVRGDKLLVREAALVDRAAKINEVNVVGWQGPRARNNDDRGQTFDSTALAPRWSEGERGEVFAVVATTRKVLHGAVYLRMIEPVLRYAEISLNGARRVLRDGEQLTVKATDLVKVERVVTNLQSDDGVVFQIVDEKTTGTTPEIRFLRSGVAFAKIPLSVRD